MSDPRPPRTPRPTEGQAELRGRAGRRAPAGRPGRPAAPPEPPAGSVLSVIREWADTLVIAFVATMFVRIFMLELFKIPSGSMTPTLIGTAPGGGVATADINRDGKPDMVLLQADGPRLAFVNDGHRLIAQPGAEIPDGLVGRQRNDRILVNKMAFWFHPPRRGDIVVFKVPPAIYKPEAPIFIKRCVGLPGEVLSFDAEGKLVVDGRPVADPDFFDTQRYRPFVDWAYARIPEISYAVGGVQARIQSIHVPQDKVYVFGDNTASSLDSRYWGGVLTDNVKGRAFFRYWPLSQMKFLKGS